MPIKIHVEENNYYSVDNFLSFINHSANVILVNEFESPDFKIKNFKNLKNQLYFQIEFDKVIYPLLIPNISPNTIEELFNFLSKFKKNQLKIYNTEIFNNLMNVFTHDLRNSINNILLSTAQFKMNESLPLEDQLLFVNIIENSCERITNSLQSLSIPLQDIDLKIKKTYLLDFYIDLQNEFIQQHDESKIKLHLTYDQNYLLNIDSQAMIKAFNEVINNAVEVITYHGNIYINMERIENKGVDQFTIVHDGKAIDKAKSTIAFYPFYTTKNKHEGLGLITVKKIIEAHNGEVYFKFNEQDNSSLILSFPIGE